MFYLCVAEEFQTVVVDLSLVFGFLYDDAVVRKDRGGVFGGDWGKGREFAVPMRSG